MASAKPATVPVASAAGTAETLNTVPDVPIETMTSPSTAPSPSAAAALSPAPGAERRPGPLARPSLVDRAPRGRCGTWPSARCTSSGR